MGIIMLRGSSDGGVADVVDRCLLARLKSAFDKAIEDGDAYSWANATYDYAASDTILGVQNNSDVRDLHIEKIWLTGDTATEFIVHTSSGATMAGTAVVGVNLNRASSNVAPATAIGDETGNGQAAASYSGRIVTGRIAADGIAEINLGGALVLPEGWNVGVDFVTDGTGANVVIWGYFKNNS